MDTNTTASSKLDVYEIVNDLLIERLEKGIIPWKESWATSGIPTNLLSLRPYRAINLWLLASLGYTKSLFLTWDQVKQVGGSVNRGEKGHIVAYWQMIPKEKTRMVHEKAELTPHLRYYKVFNISQIRDLPDNLVTRVETFPQGISDPPATKKKNTILCEAIYNKMPLRPDITNEAPKTFYNPAQDYINMPRKKSFKDSAGYYAELFHQLIHATGHKSRLNRASVPEMPEFGADPYSIEELIAEMGGSYLSYHARIPLTPITDTVEYISGWVDRLRHDTKFAITASVYAQRAIDYILGGKEAISEKKGDVEQPEVLEE